MVDRQMVNCYIKIHI